MVSASKIRKAQEQMKISRPYAQAMKQMIGHLAQANTDYLHPFLIAHKQVKRIGYIVISSDRGLAGGLNNNLFRKILGEMRQWQDKGSKSTSSRLVRKHPYSFAGLKSTYSAA